MKYKNNPANIRSGSRWLGLLGSTNGFCEFANLEYGVRALLYILYKYYYVYRLYSVASIINRFAPPSENNTDAYVRYVLREVRFYKSYRVLPEIVYIAKAICYYETNTVLSLAYIDKVFKSYIHQFPKYNEKENVN